MTPEELIAAVREIAEGLRADMSEQIATLDKKCDAVGDSVRRMKSDSAGERDGQNQNDLSARRVAADSVPRSEFAALASRVAEMRRQQQARPMANLGHFEDAQAKCDAVLREHGLRAEPYLPGEGLVEYNIRLHKPIQKFSPRWKDVNLSIVAGDHKALNNMLAEIRSDAIQVSRDPSRMDNELEEREISKNVGGHVVTEFISRTGFIKRMSPPVRKVARFGTRSTVAQPG